MGANAAGLPLLGIAAILLAGPGVEHRVRLPLIALGIAAVALLRLWPLVWAVEVLPPRAASR